MRHSWLLSGVAIAGFLAFSVTQVRADDCQRRVARADQRLHEAIEHRGYQSEEAEHARHGLQEAREQCWNSNHRWWDADQKRWRTDRDWDENDHRDYGHHDDPDRH